MKSGNNVNSSNLNVAKYLDTSIVEQVKTFGLTTRAVWVNTSNEKQFTPHEIAQSLRRLTNKEVLESHPLHHGRHYFTLTKVEAKRICCETTIGGPFYERTKFQAYSKLLIGLKHIPGAIPLRAGAKSRILGQNAIGLPNTLMLSSDGCKVYWLRIDSAIRAKPSRMAQQLRTDVFRVVKVDAICELIRQRRFELVLVVCTQARANAILELFKSYERVGATPIRTIVLPELIPLITSVPLADPDVPTKTLL